MKSLYDLQKWVQKNIRQEAPISRLEVDAYTNETKNLEHQTRWEIYRNAYRVRIIESLESDFSVLRLLLTPEIFNSLMRLYIEEFPSRYPTLAQVGEDVPKFFTHEKNKLQWPWAEDFSRFELLLTLVKTCDPEKSFDKERLSLLELISPENLNLKISNSLHLLSTKYPVGEMYKEHSIKQSRASCWVIWSFEFTPYFQEVSKAEALALQAALCGASFGEVLQILSNNGVDENQVGSVFQSWMENRWIVDLSPTS